MKIHELKLNIEFCDAVLSGEKSFEIRENDRGYQKGDHRCVILAHPDNTVELVIDTEFASPYDNGHNVQRYSLAEVPTPHSRLIDADVLENQVARWRDSCRFQDAQILCTVIDMIHKAPTVIEAEGVNE